MSEEEQIRAAQPVGHGGVRVNIQERPAAMVTGWLGVGLLLGCVAGMVIAVMDEAGGWTALPFVVFFLALSSLVIVAPGQTRVVQFFGSYVGTARQPGLWWILPLTFSPCGERTSAQLRDQSAQGQRRRRQPGRDCGHCGLAGSRHCESHLLSRRLSRTSYPSSPNRLCGTWPPAIPMTTPKAAAPPCVVRPMWWPPQLAPGGS